MGALRHAFNEKHQTHFGHSGIGEDGAVSQGLQMAKKRTKAMTRSNETQICESMDNEFLSKAGTWGHSCSIESKICSIVGRDERDSPRSGTANVEE